MKYLRKYKIEESLDVKKALRLKLRRFKDLDKDDLTWFISELGYKLWQDKDSNVNSLKDVYNHLRDTYGELAEFAALLKNYIGQVNNGGHAQYYGNGYAGSGGGAFGSHGDDMTFHNRMVELAEECADDLGEEEWYQNFMKIINSFDIELDEERTIEDDCQDCGGSGEQDCQECDGRGQIDCGECDGYGEVDDEDCGSCGGDGSEECSSCYGNGYQECDYCERG